MKYPTGPASESEAWIAFGNLERVDPDAKPLPPIDATAEPITDEQTGEGRDA